jgi:ubiquinone/menaquinone biosynthesis C-methylase UbiE
MSEWDKKRDIMQRYDVGARMYDMRYAEEQTAKINAALKSLGTKMKGYVLDVGCGTGLLFNHVADKAEMLIGLDISRKTLHEARKRAGSYPNTCLVLADADYLPFVTNVFSFVFAFTLIQNLPNPNKTLREIKRVANNDAMIVVTGMKKAYTRRSLRGLLKDNGLSIHALEDEGLKCYVATCKKLHV